MIAAFVCALLFAIPVPVPPVHGTVVATFRPPACERCAGHRGITVATERGSHVRSVRAGIVTFSGKVAGLVYVVQEIRPGVRVTYGWLAGSDVTKGEMLEAGTIVGSTGDRTYLGVRIGGAYVDPLLHLGFTRARLVGPQRVVGGRSTRFR